jgi:hypothetical protein
MIFWSPWALKERTLRQAQGAVFFCHPDTIEVQVLTTRHSNCHDFTRQRLPRPEKKRQGFAMPVCDLLPSFNIPEIQP